MDKAEFFEWMKADWSNFHSFLDSVYNDGNFYVLCKLCGFRTNTIKSHDTKAMERVDNSAINHLLSEKHIGDVPKKYNEYRSKQIALKKGQTTLDVL